MQKVFITIGNIGCGKSTWAKKYVEEHPNTVIVSKDSIREMLYGKYDYREEDESLISSMMIELTSQLININKNVILDETNESKIYRFFLISEIDARFPNDIYFIGVYFPHPKAGWDDDFRNIKRWCVDRRMNCCRGYSREKWEEVWDIKEANFDIPTEDEFDELIIVK